MTQLLHGTTKSDWVPHIGACLTEDEGVALSFAEMQRGEPLLFAVNIDLDSLCVRKVQVTDRTNGGYPGDSAASITSLQADGVDVVEYADETEGGRQFICWRLISAAAVAVCSSYECEWDGKW